MSDDRPTSDERYAIAADGKLRPTAENLHAEVRKMTREELNANGYPPDWYSLPKEERHRRELRKAEHRGIPALEAAGREIAAGRRKPWQWRTISTYAGVALLGMGLGGLVHEATDHGAPPACLEAIEAGDNAILRSDRMIEAVVRNDDAAAEAYTSGLLVSIETWNATKATCRDE